MYKYSKRAQERFFSVPIFAYLFFWFSKSPEGIHFTQTKFLQKGQDYFARMKVEIEELRSEALEWIRKQAKGDQMCNLLLQHIED